MDGCAHTHTHTRPRTRHMRAHTAFHPHGPIFPSSHCLEARGALGGRPCYMCQAGPCSPGQPVPTGEHLTLPCKAHFTQSLAGKAVATLFYY